MTLPLVVEGLGHAYAPGAPVLEGVDLTLAQGELVALVGASGSGKTTLLRCLAGLTTPARGRVVVGGAVVAEGGRERVPAERRGVGLVFQEYALFPAMTVRDNVAFGCPDPARVDALLAATGLADLAARRPAQLSGGQQQRVALARALAAQPHVLLLDEPFANVDAPRRLDLGQEVRALLAGQGASALLVTHDAQDAMTLADRVAVLEGPPGRIVQCDAPEVVYARPVDAAIAARLGPCAFVPAEARGESASTPFGEVALVAARTGPVTLLVRPEQARFEAGAGDARVVARAFVGRGARVRVRAGEREVLAEAPLGARAGDAGRVVVVGPCWALPG
ncbi:MAG: ABC transporter ATP-binding protein [Planctomycetes bacterium]|nr:ABC transporter ATP-binding protein [Planctomycetota bacterium]